MYTMERIESICIHTYFYTRTLIYMCQVGHTHHCIAPRWYIIRSDYLPDPYIIHCSESGHEDLLPSTTHTRLPPLLFICLHCHWITSLNSKSLSPKAGLNWYWGIWTLVGSFFFLSNLLMPPLLQNCSHGPLLYRVRVVIGGGLITQFFDGGATHPLVGENCPCTTTTHHVAHDLLVAVVSPIKLKRTVFLLAVVCFF